MNKFFAVAAVATLALAALLFHPQRPAEPAVRIEPAAPRPAHTAAARPVVYVAGRVAHPGLFTLEANARVDDAIRAAGGLARDADPVAVNLAARVVDGEEVAVPPLGAPAATRERPPGKGRSKGPRRRRGHAVPVTPDGDVAGDPAGGL